jgi:biotin carboxylase
MVVRKVYTQVQEQQASSNKPITVAEIMSMIAAQKQREQAMDNLRSAMALLRLQNYIEEVEKKKKAEEQRRIREAQTTLAFLSLFN